MMKIIALVVLCTTMSGCRDLVRPGVFGSSVRKEYHSRSSNPDFDGRAYTKHTWGW